MQKFLLLLILILSMFNLPLAYTQAPDDHVLYPYTIDGLRERDYEGGVIESRYVIEQYADFQQVYIAYPSDSLTITGVMNIPNGGGPLPVVILLHGYYDRDTYWSGLGTWQAAEYFARSGFLTIAPDFRSWGNSDTGINLFATGLTIDVLNLISSIASLEQANTDAIFVWGHSMGGGVATKTAVIDDRIRAVTLYAPNSADDADIFKRWGPACLPGQSEARGDHCNPAEVLPPDIPSAVQDAYFDAGEDIMLYLAPIYHLENVAVPVQIHIGTADGAALEQTPPEWSEKLYDALLEAERDVTYHVYPDQGHFFTGQDWTLMMERTVDFFMTQLNP